jgi:hypothetical protein
MFWNNVTDKDFDLFFQKFPKKPIYPKVMWVWDTPKDAPCQRVVFMEKCGKFLAWNEATTIEDAESSSAVSSWSCAKDIEEVIEMSIEDIAKKLNVDPQLLRIKK